MQAARPTPAATGRKPSPTTTESAPVASSAEVRRLEELLRKKLQTGVQIHLTARDRGEAAGVVAGEALGHPRVSGYPRFRAKGQSRLGGQG